MKVAVVGLKFSMQHMCVCVRVPHKRTGAKFLEANQRRLKGGDVRNRGNPKTCMSTTTEHQRAEIECEEFV